MEQKALAEISNNLSFLRYWMWTMDAAAETHDPAILEPLHMAYEAYCRSYGIDYKCDPQENIDYLTSLIQNDAPQEA